MLLKTLFCFFLIFLLSSAIEISEDEWKVMKATIDLLKIRIGQQDQKLSFQEEKIASYNKMITSQNERIASQDKKIASNTEKMFLFAKRNCHEYKVSGIGKSDWYPIDPDGLSIGDAPFMAYCDMDTGSTIVHHDSENSTRVPLCSDKDCFQHRINYKASQKQLRSLIDLSMTCTQKIRFDCFLAPLSVAGTNFGTWINHRGEPEKYFSGSISGIHQCQCGLDNNCTKSEYKCNCDANDPKQDFDEGIITNMNALPILGFNYYGLTYASEKGSISYGPLECTGIKQFSPGNSCYDLKLQGAILSGFYLVSSGIEVGQGPKHETVFCDFTQSLDSTELQENVLPPIKFEAINWDVGMEGHSITGILTYTSLSIHYGWHEPMIDLTTGYFTAPKSGTYFFYLLGMTFNWSVRAVVEFRVNDQVIESWFSNSDLHDDRQNGHIPMNFNVYTHLNKGDRVYVKLRQGGLWVKDIGNDKYKVHFGGKLIYV